MTHQEKLSAVTKWIQSSCPELMELKRGCLFEENFDLWMVNCDRCDDGTVFAFSCTADKHDFGVANVTEESKWVYKYNNFSKEYMQGEYVNILGSPIGIAEVIIAYELINGWADVDREEMTASREWYMTITKLVALWDKHKDRLEDQSEETIEFLYSFTKS